MSREIKFRAWDKSNHEMYNDKSVKRMTYYSTPIVYDDGYIQMEAVGSSAIGDHPIGERHIIMQYTGLKDKNGKEIYEGDILRVLDRDWPSQLDSHPELSHEQYLDSISSICEVVHNEDRFELKEIKGKGYFHKSLRYYWEYRTIFEVVGNIYENPELLSLGHRDFIK